ncbi:flavin monoamine oxidase family protein [Williamsia sp. SKLECPSW1]
MPDGTDHDVVVVGAGVSGLVAARDLRRSGVDVVVLEASSRCGGRTLTVTSSLGSAIDLGGQWIGYDHHRFRALADDLGAARFPMRTAPMPTIVAGGRPRSALSPVTLLAAALLGLIEIGRRRHPPRRWSDRSIADLLHKIPAAPRRVLEVTAAISWTADPHRISMRTAAQMMAGQGGLATMLATRGGAQHELLVDGTGALVDALAAELGDAIRLDTPVTTLDRDDLGVTVHDASGVRRARAVVIAVPPPVAARITHRPSLPTARAVVEQGMEMGSVFKAIAVYPTPFWRGHTSGELLVLDRPGCAVYDTSAPGGPGHLCLLVGGPEARDLDALSPRARRDLLLSRLVGRLGPQVSTPADWHEKSWHTDAIVGGGYGALPVLGGGVDLPLPTRPVGRVHFAGSETARDHPGYIDGAIEAGERAAREVLAADLR